MLTCYALTTAGLIQHGPWTAGQDVSRLAWIDLLNPEREEEQQVEDALGLDLPTREEMAEIEDSSRFYKENGALYLTATVMWQSETQMPSTTDVTFVLVRNLLVTVRYADPRPFRTFAAQVERQPGLCANGETALLGLLDTCLDRVADHIEKASLDIDQLVHNVLSPSDRPQRGRGGFNYATMLRQLERSQTILAKARMSLLGLMRLLSYVARPTADVTASKSLRSQVLTLIHDVRSLLEYTNYLANNINFELSAILGMVSIEQNNIIKIFSVAAVVFLPPTLVASIYGMNFRHMPELEWLAGYPLAIVLMLGSAALPYLWFKRRGWL
jgi:magnesium transporter